MGPHLRRRRRRGILFFVSFFNGDPSHVFFFFFFFFFFFAPRATRRGGIVILIKCATSSCLSRSSSSFLSEARKSGRRLRCVWLLLSHLFIWRSRTRPACCLMRPQKRRNHTGSGGRPTDRKLGVGRKIRLLPHIFPLKEVRRSKPNFHLPFLSHPHTKKP